VNLRRPVQSHAERREYFSRLLQRSGVRIDVRPDDIAIDGAIAIVRGRIEFQTEPDDQRGASVGELRYLEVVRKCPDGSWKAICGMDGPVQDA
jgi:ketosteroid isomerase-like protein